MIDLNNVSLNLIETTEDISAFKEWLSLDRPVMGCDTETSGLEWWHGRLRTVQFGDFRAGWTIPWERCEALFTRYSIGTPAR